MKIWKIVGITGVMLASLSWSGVAQADRFQKRHHYNNHRIHQNYGHQQRPHWAGARHHRPQQHNWYRNHYNHNHQRYAEKHHRPQQHNWYNNHYRYAGGPYRW